MRLLCASLLLLSRFSFGQSIADPCFQSIPAGQFYGSEDIQNICLCRSSNIAADMLEWDSQANEWLGMFDGSEVFREPPPGCNQKALWIGSKRWTQGGEAFALRVTSTFEAGKAYSYTFTYASAGRDGNGNFSPLVYTSGEKYPKINETYYVGNLPSTDYWNTATITFTATEKNAGHYWLIIHSPECSGLILSNCNITNPIREDLIEESSLLFCQGDRIQIQGPNNPSYQYHWSTGATGSSIYVTESGTYTLDITNSSCTSSDSIEINFKDCETRLIMPNIFTPNDDGLNDAFLPIEHNYLTSGQLKIYNRWGESIFVGDLFLGWDGETSNNQLVPSGIYFYEILYVNEDDRQSQIKGMVTLSK